MSPEERAAKRAERTAELIAKNMEIQAKMDRSMGSGPANQAKRTRLDAFHNDPTLTKSHLDAVEKAGNALSGQGKPMTADDYVLLNDVFGQTSQPVLDASGRQMKGEDGKPMFTKDTAVDPKSPLGKFQEKFQREKRRQDRAVSTEFAERVKRENPQDRDALFSILDEVTAPYPLAANGFRKSVVDGDLPEGIKLNEKLAAEMKAKRISPLATKLGMKTEAEFLERRSERDTYLATELKMTPEQIAQANADLDAGDPDEVLSFTTWNNQRTPIEEARKEKKENETKRK